MKSIFAVFMLIFASAAWADATPVEQYLMSQGVKIGMAFTSETGLKAIVADAGGQKRLFYVTPDGNHLIAGNVYDIQGRNLTELDLSRVQVPMETGIRLTDKQLTDLYERASHASAKLHDGFAGPTVYAIFDPNCPVCHNFYTRSREAVKAGRLQIEWLPVAVLQKSSAGLIAALYQAPDKGVAMQQMVYRTLPEAAVSKPLDLAVAKNILLMRDSQSRRVPTFIVKNEDKITVLVGLGDPALRTFSDTNLISILQ